MDGIISINENIADNGGIKEAFIALQKLQQGSRSAMSPDEYSHYTAEQLFFYAFAMVSALWISSGSK